MVRALKGIEVPATYDTQGERKVSLVYLDTGEESKKPVLFLGPFGATTDIWEPFQSTYFARNGYRFLALNMRGHGASEGTAKEQGAYSISLFAKDVATLIDAIGIKCVDIVGASMGGMIALEYAHMHPERINKLVLVGSYAGPLQEHEASFREDHNIIRERGIEALRREKNKDVSYYGKPYSAMDREERNVADAYFRNLAAMRMEEYVATDLAIARKPDQRLYLQELGNRLQNKVLLVAGETDFFRQAQDEMHESIPTSRLEIIADAGHLCWSNTAVEAEFGFTVFSFLNERA